MRWLKHAFAVDASAVVEPSERQRAIVDRLCWAVVTRGMATPALLYLEMTRPLNYIGSQALHFFQPVLSAIFDTQGYEEFARFLEKRGSVDYLTRRVREIEARYEQERRRRADSGGGAAAKDRDFRGRGNADEHEDHRP